MRSPRTGSPRDLFPVMRAAFEFIAGEDDTLFPLDQADANLRGLPADTPARLTWVAGGHDGVGGPALDQIGGDEDRVERHRCAVGNAG